MHCTGDYCENYGYDADGNPKTYSVSVQPIGPYCWFLRTHEGDGGTYTNLDDYVGSTNLRAERWVWDDDTEAMRHDDAPRPYAHMFGTMGRYPASAHRKAYDRLRLMGFLFAYLERKTVVEGVMGLRVIVTDLRTMKKKVTFVPLENKHETFPPGYFDPPAGGGAGTGGAV